MKESLKDQIIEDAAAEVSDIADKVAGLAKNIEIATQAATKQAQAKVMEFAAGSAARVEETAAHKGEEMKAAAYTALAQQSSALANATQALNTQQAWLRHYARRNALIAAISAVVGGASGAALGLLLASKFT